jgi:hypothetical protein
VTIFRDFSRTEEVGEVDGHNPRPGKRSAKTEFSFQLPDRFASSFQPEQR